MHEERGWKSKREGFFCEVFCLLVVLGNEKLSISHSGFKCF